MAIPMEEKQCLRSLLDAVSAEVGSHGAAELASAAAVVDAGVLDAVIVGPSKSGKSTLMNALLGQVLCPSAGLVNTLFPVAFSVATCEEEGAARAELRVPAALRERLVTAVAEKASGSSGGDLSGMAVPQDGVVRSSADLVQRLEALNKIGRAVAEELLSDPASLMDLVEVTRFMPSTEKVHRRWRIVDFPGTSERGSLATARLTQKLLERRLQSSSTGLLLCVVAKDQVGSESAEQCFAPIARCHQPRLWLINKVDTEGEHAEVHPAASEIQQLTRGERTFCISALQLLAYACAEAIMAQTGDGHFLPAFGSPLYDAHLHEAEAIVRALVPAASRVSKHWKQQYEDAWRCSKAQLSRATHFPEQEANPGNGDESAGAASSEDLAGSNAELRPAIWAELSRAKLRLVLQHMRPAVRASVEEVTKKLADVQSAGKTSEDLPSITEKSQRARAALHGCLASSVEQDKARLAAAIVDVAEQHIQRAFSERLCKPDSLAGAVNCAAANDGEAKVSEQRENAAEEESETQLGQFATIHTALEEAEESLMQLQRKWIVNDTHALEAVCGPLDVVEPIALVSEVERQAGVARTFESVLFMIFSKFTKMTGEATEESDWFASTAKFYADGIRRAAPNVAARVVDTSRSRIIAVLERLEADLVQAQWDLAESDRWSTKLQRLQGALSSILWLQQGLQVPPLEEDLAQISEAQRMQLQLAGETGEAKVVAGGAASQQATGTKPAQMVMHDEDESAEPEGFGLCSLHTGPDAADVAFSLTRSLHLKHPDWAWWMASQPAYCSSTFMQLHRPENSPGSEQELLDAVRQLVFLHAVTAGISQGSATDFVQRAVCPCLQDARSDTAPKSSSGGSAGEISKTDESRVLARAASALWRSVVQLRGKELCSIINGAIRADVQPALLPAVQFMLALHPLHLEGTGTLSMPTTKWWPIDGCVFRGGWFPDCHQGFFSEGRQFRSPMATSFHLSRGPAHAQAQRKAAPADGRHPVIWAVRLDPVRRSAHAFLLDGELLFVPYACFRVEGARWQKEASAENPHVVELFAYPDSDGEAGSEWWPTAPWG